MGTTASTRRRLEDFPGDIMVNIFSRLHVKSLMCSRCVCKTWRNIIDAPYFTYMHFNTSTTEGPKLMLLQYENIRFFSLMDGGGGRMLRSSESPMLEIENFNDYFYGSLCYGLFCFKKSRHSEQVFLLNPLRGEVLMLPPTTVTPHKDLHGQPGWVFDFYGVGFDCRTETFKVVCVSPCRFDNGNYSLNDSVAQVYTLGTRSWREIPTAPPCCLSGRAVSAYGDVHWIGHSHESCEDMIISFDTRKEEFKLTPHPKLPTKRTIRITYKLVDLRGHLAMIKHSSTTHFEVWLLKDYDKKEWAMEYRISIKMLFGRRTLFFGLESCVIGVWEHGLLFCMGDTDLVYYNTKTDSIKSISIPLNIRYSRNKTIIGYKGSLVSLKNSGNIIARDAQEIRIYDSKRSRNGKVGKLSHISRQETLRSRYTTPYLKGSSPGFNWLLTIFVVGVLILLTPSLLYLILVFVLYISVFYFWCSFVCC